MNWVLLIVAGLFEVGWAIGLKYTESFTKPLASVLTVGAMIVSLVLLGMAVKTLPLGTAYAVWVGIGLVGSGVLGVVLFQEPLTVLRVLCLTVILAGVVGLKLSH